MIEIPCPACHSIIECCINDCDITLERYTVDSVDGRITSTTTELRAILRVSGPHRCSV